MVASEAPRPLAWVVGRTIVLVVVSQSLRPLALARGASLETSPHAFFASLVLSSASFSFPCAYHSWLSSWPRRLQLPLACGPSFGVD